MSHLGWYRCISTLFRLQGILESQALLKSIPHEVDLIFLLAPSKCTSWSHLRKKLWWYLCTYRVLNLGYSLHTWGRQLVSGHYTRSQYHKNLSIKKSTYSIRNPDSVCIFSLQSRTISIKSKIRLYDFPGAIPLCSGHVVAMYPLTSSMRFDQS